MDRNSVEALLMRILNSKGLPEGQRRDMGTSAAECSGAFARKTLARKLSALRAPPAPDQRASGRLRTALDDR